MGKSFSQEDTEIEPLGSTVYLQLYQSFKLATFPFHIQLSTSCRWQKESDIQPGMFLSKELLYHHIALTFGINDQIAISLKKQKQNPQMIVHSSHSIRNKGKACSKKAVNYKAALAEPSLHWDRRNIFKIVSMEY